MLQSSLGWCDWPNSYCLLNCKHTGVGTAASGDELDVSNPEKMRLPNEGTLEITFVDLTPVSKDAAEMQPAQFKVLMTKLVSEKVRYIAALVTFAPTNEYIT